MLFSSCDQDITNVINLPGGEATTTPATQKEITFTASMDDGTKTRAVETTIANLDSFFVTAYNVNGVSDNPLWMKDVKYTTPDQGATWAPESGNYYWPMQGYLKVYAYSNIGAGRARLNSEKKEIIFYQKGNTAAQHQDFVYARGSGTYGECSHLIFKHALSEVSVKAKNSNTEYTVEVSGVKISNIKGTSYFDLDKETWELPGETVEENTTTWANPVKLTADASYMDKANEPFMFIPQTVDKSTNKIYAKIKVIKDNVTIYDGWSSVPLSGTWERGKHYVYTLDFSQGLGTGDSGKINIATINFGTSFVFVSDWVSKDEDVNCGKE